MNHLERFLAVMEYQPVDRVPNWEAGVWAETRDRWGTEGLDTETMHWNWFPGEAELGMDPREFVFFNGGMIPPFKYEVIEEDERTFTFRDSMGTIRRRLRPEFGASMDTFLNFTVESMADWQKIKSRFDPTNPKRYEPNWDVIRAPGWQNREWPLIFAPNTQTKGFYWLARELLGIEGLAFGWFDQPETMLDMMSFQADFLIEAIRPILEKTTIEYVIFAEDLSMKTGPMISPRAYKKFIYPHLRRVVDFYKSHGVRYIFIDTDGNPEKLIPQFLDAGVDGLWPLERAADQDPIRLRKEFGRKLLLTGGVDKREIAKGPAAIDAHLRELMPLIEEGGFIPTIDHTASPDISWENFQYYWQQKQKMLRGKL